MKETAQVNSFYLRYFNRLFYTSGEPDAGRETRNKRRAAAQAKLTRRRIIKLTKTLILAGLALALAIGGGHSGIGIDDRRRSPRKRRSISDVTGSGSDAPDRASATLSTLTVLDGEGNSRATVFHNNFAKTDSRLYRNWG